MDLTAPAAEHATPVHMRTHSPSDTPAVHDHPANPMDWMLLTPLMNPHMAASWPASPRHTRAPARMHAATDSNRLRICSPALYCHWQ